MYNITILVVHGANANRDTLISKDYKSATDSFIVKRNNYVDVPEGVIFIKKAKNKE